MFYDKDNMELKWEQNTSHKNRKLTPEKKEGKDKAVLEHKDCFDALPHFDAQRKAEEAKNKGKRKGRNKRRGNEDEGIRYQ